MKKTIALIASFIVAAAALFECGCDNKGNAQTKGKPNAGQLIGNWVMTALQAKPPVAGTTVTLRFKGNGTFDGFSGINSYGGKFTSSSNGSLHLSQIITTLMASTNPAVQAQESEYLTALGLVARYGIVSNRLTLADSAGGTLVVYKGN